MFRRVLIALFVILGLSLVIAYAQEHGRLYVGPTTDADIRWAKKVDFDGSILFCRGHYSSTREEANGSGWWTDYPGADNNFLVRLSELTEVHVRFDKKRIPFYVVIPLNDKLIHKCPILFMEDVGTIGFREDEIRNMRNYFDKGGFLWVDDFWGTLAWEQWESEIRRVLPADKYDMIDIPKNHPIMHTLYDVKEIQQQPTAGIWYERRAAAGEDLTFSDPRYYTSERFDDSLDVHFRAILDQKGRIVVVMTHNTDIADGWEEEKPENYEYLHEFSARSYAIGINIFLYALTH